MALYEQLEQNGKVMVGRILSNFKKFLSTTTDPQDVRVKSLMVDGSASTDKTQTDFSIGQTRTVFTLVRGATYIATVKNADGSGHTIALVLTNNSSDSITVAHIVRNSVSYGLDFVSSGLSLQVENKTGAATNQVRISLLRVY